MNAVATASASTTDAGSAAEAIHIENLHKKFGQLVGPVLGDVFVIDFWAKD